MPTTKTKRRPERLEVLVGCNVPDPFDEMGELRLEPGEVVPVDQFAKADLDWLLARGAVKEV